VVPSFRTKIGTCCCGDEDKSPSLGNDIFFYHSPPLSYALMYG
jgi:hypothetical protein